MKVALLFGSFDPVHNAHLWLGRAALRGMDCKEVWYVLTPCSPAKQSIRPLLKAIDRLLLLRLALWGQPHLRATGLELERASPQYTIDTLALLEKRYPLHHFSLLMGEDTLTSLPSWKEGAALLSRYRIAVYGRKGTKASSLLNSSQIHYIEGPLQQISSTQIREGLKTEQDLSGQLPEAVLRCIQKKRFYWT